MNTAVSDNVATKADLKLLEVKVDTVRSENKAGFEATASKDDLRALEVRLIKWVVSTLIAVGALNVAAMGILL